MDYKTEKKMAWIALASYAVYVLFILWGVFLGIGGMKTQEIFKGVSALFMPMNYVLWYWIFVLVQLGLFAIWQANPRHEHGGIFTLSKLFIVLNVVHVLWLLAWHMRKMWLALIFSIGLFLILAILLSKAEHIQRSVKNIGWISLVFGFSLGAISFIVVASLAASLDAWSIPIATSQLWNGLLFALFTLLGLLFTVGNRNVFSGIAVLWVLIGAFLKQAITYKASHVLLLIISFFMMAIMIIAIYYQMTNNMKKNSRKRRRRRNEEDRQVLKEAVEEEKEEKEADKVEEVLDEIDSEEILKK